MSRGARLSILGMYEYDSTVFDGLTVPTGMTKQTVVDSILLECAELELVYPDLDIMKAAITNWSSIEGPIWTKLYNTESLVYQPLWNVDATVQEILDGAGIGSTKGYNSTTWLENDKMKTDNTVTTTRSGNIGTTSSQQLLTEERAVVQFSTIKYMVDSFKKRFCLMIY